MEERDFTDSRGTFIQGGRVRNKAGAYLASIEDWDVQAGIEYGRHLERIERDKALGRWRSPTRPEIVVYPGNPGYVQVFSESTCYTAVYNEDGARGAERATIFAEVAVEYFDAHKPEEPKPWQDARPGEAWLLAIDDKEAVPMTVARDSDGVLCFWAGDDAWARGDSGITAGRRIWPVSETSEEEES